MPPVLLLLFVAHVRAPGPEDEHAEQREDTKQNVEQARSPKHGRPAVGQRAARTLRVGFTPGPEVPLASSRRGALSWPARRDSKGLR